VPALVEGLRVKVRARLSSIAFGLKPLVDLSDVGELTLYLETTVVEGGPP
jgi:hypothetical protein